MTDEKWRSPNNDYGPEVGLDNGDVETFKKEPEEALARETGQNSNDARYNSSYTKMEYKLFEVEHDAIPGIDELSEMIEACYEYKKELPKEAVQLKRMLERSHDKKIKCLRISDFHTSGLEGVLSNDAEKPFYLLTKGSGISYKGNVKFLTDEALATIKANLDKFTKIVKENPSDSSSFIAELPEECFVEKKYPIEDFELEVDGDGDYSKVDVDNAITLYEHLCCLPKHVLGDERFWMWLILEKCYAATIQAMPMESGKKIIADHWLFGQGRRRGLMFGALSRAYYRVQLTKDDTLEDAYELTKFATQNYMRYREFTWRGYSNNKTIVTGALKGEKKAIAKYGDTIETIKDYYPSIAKHISQLGSVMLLDFMREDYILDSVLAFCDSLAEANNIMPIK